MDLKKIFFVEFFGTLFLTISILGTHYCYTSHSSNYEYGAVSRDGADYWIFFLALGFCGLFTMQAYGSNLVVTMNPATMLVYFFEKKINLKDWLISFIFQVAAAFCGGFLIWLQNTDQGSVLDNVTFWASMNSSSVWDGIFENLLGSFVWMTLLLILADVAFVPDLPKSLYSFLAGLSWAMCIHSFGRLTYTIYNPAIDVGLRIWSLTQSEEHAFSKADGYFWIPLVIPFAGVTLGFLFYKFVVVKFVKA
ncbi:Aquaporin-like protein [Pseudocohnilembus persalinus]|uniref:Aquaporin-like protein n=1 Tax=Pseudocohnilembus persalinus TaxID=266149 RepID=A0A0V0QTA5_PSEPJ|nr:Aquaporin-like protein [Pseudocohnilembus persalinus]|eukprot:KRX05210.1 Aquaporin-like protein [Pseudocohnilembus persalinus]